jgi:prepilin-type processing-associated H-X9-DG protein
MIKSFATAFLLCCAASADETSDYIVQAGDFPEKIATAKGITLQQLLAANPGFDATKMTIGQVLKIPASEKAVKDEAKVLPIDPEKQKKIDELCNLLVTGNPKERRQARKDLNAFDKNAVGEFKAALDKATDPEVSECLRGALAKFDVNHYKALNIEQIKDAKNKLKQMAMCPHSYLLDGVALPAVAELGIDIALTDVADNGRPLGSIEDFGKGEADIVPLWKEGDGLAAVNNAKSALAFLRPEFTPGSIVVLFGDGHVEIRPFTGKTTDAAKKEFGR